MPPQQMRPVVLLLPHLPRAVLPLVVLLPVAPPRLPRWAKARSRMVLASALCPAPSAPSLRPRPRVLVLSVVFLVSHKTQSLKLFLLRRSLANIILSQALSQQTCQKS